MNATRTVPYVNRLEAEFGPQGLRVLGIHAPEFEWERDLERYAAAKEEFNVAFPSYFDRDLVFTDRLQSPGWPVLSVVDREGRIRGEWFGEVHPGTSRAAAVEKLVKELLSAE